MTAASRAGVIGISLALLAGSLGLGSFWASFCGGCFCGGTCAPGLANCFSGFCAAAVTGKTKPRTNSEMINRERIERILCALVLLRHRFAGIKRLFASQAQDRSR